MTRLNGLRLTIAISAMAMGLLYVQPRLAFAGDSSSTSQAGATPVIESVGDTLAFISWTTQNPGGTILHYAVVRYGKDPDHLDLTAESPTRINPGHSEMVFRVRVGNLQPATTYYYKVWSERADGVSDPVASALNKFTTRPANRMSEGK
jgi:phosphodiesterase/alkaline phosphatase D-like protein